MLNINDIQETLQQELDSGTLEDQTVSNFTGGFTYEKIPLGKHLVRLVSYIEYGNQPQPDYKGQPKPDAPEVGLTLEFLSKRTIKEKEDGSGKYAPRKSFYLKKSFNEKSSYRKLFEKLRAGDTSITHMAQMVGKMHWIINVEWTTKEDGEYIIIKKKDAEKYEKRLKDNPDNKDFRIFENIKNADGYMISPAVRELVDDDGEPTGEVQPVPCVEAIGPLAVFKWDIFSPLFWDSIYIDGTYTKKDGDKEIEVSKNRHQEKCLAASDFEGSSLQAALDGLGDLDTDAPAEEPEEEEEKPKTKKKAAKKATKKKEAPAEEEDDDLEEEKSETSKVVDEIDDEMEELGL